ncbi:Predicted kinase, aminoglycoside phosphotransferase (APT) family [Actinoplanes derwentensis]|uniref:Predicted kinase, aminoglycoside phosphotransferase (APT) family n=2 Tax=Actinoplanes derwentensis TaxID=113562 RepID=A0A1H1T9F8_9ACTN|nr:Predicted kinase, aminoglycoside phosphotransferase (APT) family [Actinoplanes derwentensis]
MIREQCGLTSGEARLIRFTMNAVYRLGDRVIRLNRGEPARQRAARVVAGTALLHRHGVPAVELVDDIVQPVVAGDWVATVWHYLPHPPGRPAAVELVEPLARIHAITEPVTFLPAWSPMTSVRHRLSAAGDDFTRAWAVERAGMRLDTLVGRLTAQCAELDRRIAAATWELPPGVIHGDAHVGNLLAGRLCDFDSLAVGPREWDHVPLAHSVVRFGDPAEPYREFAAAYGFDLTGSPAWPLLRDIRDLQLATSVFEGLAGRPEVAENQAHRLRTYLAGDETARWSRHL